MKENDVSSFSQSPLIRYLSNLQVTRTDIKARISANLGWIELLYPRPCIQSMGVYTVLRLSVMPSFCDYDFVSTQYLENELMEFDYLTKFWIYIAIDKI